MMLEKYAQDISEYMSAMMGRSIIITDVNGIILGSPNKERIGDVHSPSIPCAKYKKMSFDDLEDIESAKKPGVWYYGCTLPIFFQGKTIGTAAVAGEPEIVRQLAALVQRHIESLIKENLRDYIVNKPQMALNEFIQTIGKFDPLRDDQAVLIHKGQTLGIDLSIPRFVAAVKIANFSGLVLAKNPVKFSSESNADPIVNAIDCNMMYCRVIEIIREILPDPQNVIVSVARDKFAILLTTDYSDQDGLIVALESIKNFCREIHKKLKEATIDTFIGIGHPAKNVYELHMALHNASEVVRIAEALTKEPGIYCFNDFLLEHFLLSIQPNYTNRFVENKLTALNNCAGAKELINTFKVYCECSFNKREAAQKLNIHRNTLLYRLSKIEAKTCVDLNNFCDMMLLYLSLHIKTLTSQNDNKYIQ